MNRWEVGDRIIALTTIEEGGFDPASSDGYNPDSCWVHAHSGHRGTVEYVGDGTPCVRFDETGTATDVSDCEIKLWNLPSIPRGEK